MINLEVKHKIAIITLQNPTKKNALSRKLVLEFVNTLQKVNDLKDIRVLIITGCEDSFCVGADLKERKELDEEQTFLVVKELQNTFNQLSLFEIPTICALNGNAFGGGLELALACDLRFSINKAYFGLTEVSLGVIPGAGGTQRLSMIVGLAKALEMVFLAKKIEAKEALKIGLVNHVIEQNENILEYSIDVALKISKHAPLSIKSAKKAIYYNFLKNIDKSLNFEGECYREILYTKDRKEGLNAFLEKRQANFMGC